MAVLKYKDPQGNWQTLDTGSGSVSSVEITELPYGSEPTARITAGTLYIGWPDGVPVDSVITEESDNPVTSAAIYQALQEKIGIPSGGTTGQVLTKTSGTDYDAGWATPEAAPVQSVNGKVGTVVLDAQDVGTYEKPATGIPASDLAAGVIPTVPVQDVQVNGVSVLTDGVANVPIAGPNAFGTVKVRENSDGLLIDGQNRLVIAGAPSTLIKSAGTNYRPVTPLRQHESTFYGLAKASGDTSQSASSNPVGTYTDAAKVAIQKMLGIYEAPWELIRQDTFTNETEADINITVDDDGNAFSLTDVLVFVEIATGTSVGAYGSIYFQNDTTHQADAYLGANTSVTSKRIGAAMLTQQNGMSFCKYAAYTYSNGNLPWSSHSNTGNAAGGAIRLTTSNINRIIVKSITGTATVTVYGRKVW